MSVLKKFQNSWEKITKMAAKKIFHVSGSRKRAKARATLREGKGTIRINSKLLDNYQPQMARLKIMEPIILAGDIVKNLNIDVSVKGGGWQSQAEASRLAIARALVSYDNKLKPDFLEYDRRLLVADVRRGESSKPNDSKPRAKRQKSYR